MECMPKLALQSASPFTIFLGSRTYSCCGYWPKGTWYLQKLMLFYISKWPWEQIVTQVDQWEWETKIELKSLLQLISSCWDSFHTHAKISSWKPGVTPGAGHSLFYTSLELHFLTFGLFFSNANFAFLKFLILNIQYFIVSIKYFE